MRLDRDAAVRALEPLAATLELSVEEAAAGVYDLVNVTMATGVRDVSVRRGLDPRDFPLVVAGGAGPLHAAAIARELDVGALLVPRESSIFCAEGMLMSDFKHDYVRAYKAPLAAADPVRLRALFEEMSAAGRDTLSREGVTGEAVELRAALDLRYIGQWHELTVAVDLPLDVDAAEAAFHAEHDRLFGHASPGAPVEVLAARLSAVGRTQKPAARGRPRRSGGRRAARRAAGVGSGRARARADARLGRREAGGRLDADRPGDRRAREHHDRRAARLHARRRRLRGVRGPPRRARRGVRAPAGRRGVPLTAVERCGVLGVGALGGAIAARLATEGLEVAAYDLDAERVAALADVGVGAASSPGDLADRSDIVLVVLPDTPEIEAALGGETGLEAGLRDGAALLLVSTVKPATAQDLAHRLAPRGVDVLDTPVSGGPVAARAGALAIMAGGSDAAYARCLPVLETLGRPVHVGPIGHGEIAKLANNLMGSVTAIGIAEGLALAAKAGADLDKVREAIAGGSGASWILSDWLPRTVLAGRTHADFAVELMVKDMDLLEDYARELGVPLRAAELARETFTELRDAGHGGHDFSVIVAISAAEAGAPLPIDLGPTLTGGGDPTSAPGAPPLLRLTGITKRFPGVVALDGVDLTLHAGVVHALIGENGSGKSTLARVACGALAPDAGRIEVDGVERTLGSPKEALDLGIVTVTQELTLAPTLSVAENIFLGRLPRGRMRRHRLDQAASRRARRPRQPRRSRRRAPRRRRAERRAPAGGRDRARRLLARRGC